MLVVAILNFMFWLRYDTAFVKSSPEILMSMLNAPRIKWETLYTRKYFLQTFRAGPGLLLKASTKNMMKQENTIKCKL